MTISKRDTTVNISYVIKRTNTNLVQFDGKDSVLETSYLMHGSQLLLSDRRVF